MLFSKSSIQLIVTSAAVGLISACSGAMEADLNTPSDGGGDGGTGSDARSAGDGSAGIITCTTDSDCGGSALCEYKIADRCAAVGVCFTPPPPGPMCAAYSAACTCAQQNINVACTRYSSGYASNPVAHLGECEGDAGGSGTFACGAETCGDAKLCKLGMGGATPATTTATCVDFPSQCASTRTCACVKPAVGAQTCSEKDGDFTVMFLYP